VLSNFTFLYFFLAILVVAICIQLIGIRKYKKITKVILTASIASILLSAMVTVPLIKLIGNGSLYYGGSSGFYHDTLISLFAFSLYHPYDADMARHILNAFLILLGFIIVFCLTKINNPDETFLDGKTIIISLITSITIVINLLNHYITGTLYLIDRTALFFIPLMTLILMYWIEELQARKAYWATSLILISLCVLTFVNFAVNANFKKTISWPYEAHSENILDKINAEGIKEKRKMTIDFSWPFEKSIGYYVEKNKYSNLTVVKDVYDREKLNKQADYYIYYNRSLEIVGYLADQQLILKMKRDTAWIYKDDDITVFTHLDTIAGGRN
jgi:hypothetical protein